MLRFDPPPGHGSSGAISSAQVTYILVFLMIQVAENTIANVAADVEERDSLFEKFRDPVIWQAQNWNMSRRAAAGRAQLLAKRGCIGQMQTPAELVPIPDASRILPDASGCVGILNSGKFRRILAKFRQILGKN